MTVRPHSEVIAQLLDPGIISVVRTNEPAKVIPACEALLAAGIRAIELTMTIPNALSLLTELRSRVAARAAIGMGSVHNSEICTAVLEAGADFVVSPITRPEIAALCREAQRPVILGAYTPTEAQTAFETGADFVKIFPADSLGPEYIAAMRAPMPHLRLIPTGGVELQNLALFMQAGCAAVGVGSSLLSKDILRDENWPELTRLARQFVKAISHARNC